jgi:hypothetical protein
LSNPNLEPVMRLLQAAAVLLFALAAAGCATKPMASAPPAPQPLGVVPVAVPQTTYGCDVLIAHRMGKPC